MDGYSALKILDFLKQNELNQAIQGHENMTNQLTSRGSSDPPSVAAYGPEAPNEEQSEYLKSYSEMMSPSQQLIEPSQGANLPASPAGNINGMPVPQFQGAKDKVHETKLMSKLIDLARDKSRNEQLNLQMQAQKMQDEATQRQKDYEQSNGANIMGMLAAGKAPQNLPMPQGAQGVPTGADQMMLQIMGKDMNAPWDMAKAEMALQSQYQKQAMLQDKLNQKSDVDLKKARIAEALKMKELELRDKWENAKNSTKLTTTDMTVQGREEVAKLLQQQKDELEKNKQEVEDRDAYIKERNSLDTKLRNIKVKSSVPGGGESTKDFDVALQEWSNMTGGGMKPDLSGRSEGLMSGIRQQKEVWDSFARNIPKLKDTYATFNNKMPDYMKIKKSLPGDKFWGESYARLKQEFPDNPDFRKAMLWRMAETPTDSWIIKQMTMND